MRRHALKLMRALQIFGDQLHKAISSVPAGLLTNSNSLVYSLKLGHQGGPFQSYYGYEHVNVAVQRRDPNSLLNWTERIVRMRKEVPEVGWGDFQVVASRDPAVLILRYDWRNNSVLFVHNFDEKPREVSFVVELSGEAGKVLVNLLAEDHSHAGDDGKHRLMLEAYGYRWYRAGGLDYLLKRSDIDTDSTGKASHPA